MEPDALDISGYRTFGVLRHELAHAIVHQTWGRSISFLEEGLAETLGRASEDSIQPEHRGTSVQDMVSDDPTHIDYPTAARFTRYLIDAYGIERYRELFTSLHHGASEKEISAGFQAAYGKSLTALDEEYFLDGPRCTYQFEICGSEPIAVPVSWSAQVLLDCNAPTVFGRSGGLVSSTLTFEIASDGLYRLRSDYPLTLTRCGDCAVQQVAVLTDFSIDTLVNLDAGVYSLEFAAAGEPHGAVRVEIRPDAIF